MRRQGGGGYRSLLVTVRGFYFGWGDTFLGKLFLIRHYFSEALSLSRAIRYPIVSPEHGKYLMSRFNSSYELPKVHYPHPLYMIDPHEFGVQVLRIILRRNRNLC